MMTRDLIRKDRAQAAMATVVVLTLCVLSLTGWMLLDARNAVFRQAEQGATNLALSLQRDITRNVEIYDLSLKSAAASLAIPGFGNLNPEVRQAVLFDGATRAPFLGWIAIVNSAGEVIFESSSAQLHEGNFAARDWFTHLREHPESGLHLSLATNSPISSRPSLVLSRPIVRVDGSFSGAVVGVIYLDYFHELFSGLALGEDNAIALATMDGRVVSRRPFDQRNAGRDVSQAEVFQRLRIAASGSFEAQSVLDGVHRLYVYKQLDSLPLVVQVGLSTSAVYAEWRRKAWIIGVVLIVFVTITGLLTWALWQELQHRAHLTAQLRTSEAGFRLLTEHASDMVTRVGPDGMRQYISPAATRILGVPAETLLGRGLLNLIQPDDLPIIEMAASRLLAGAVEEDKATFRVHRPNGSEIWIEAIARSLHDPDTGAPDGYVGILRDVTERRRMDAERDVRGRELEAANIQLERLLRDVTERRHMDAERDVRGRELEAANIQLERLTRHLGRAREVAEQANKAKSRFLAGMSHELRTPLNGILGYAQLLHMEGKLDEKQRERVNAMLGAGQHLLGMINRVLDLSEIEAESFKVQAFEVDLQEVAGMCLGLVRPAAEAKHLELKLATGPNIPQRILADPAWLRQLLLNLLGNAVKFTVQGSVELRLLVADNMRLRIEVADSGPGISFQQRHRLFQDFERLDAKCSVNEGAGLGLIISARLVGLMGGHIGHNDNPNGGSVFWLELPMVAMVAELAAVAIIDPAPQPNHPLRLLVVDDVAMNRDIASSILRAAGHNVTCAESGSEAVEEASTRDYDALLMDVRMPGMDGLEATGRIRALAGARGKVPIIALTAQAFAGQVDECRQAGMNSHVAKPFTQEALLQAIACVVVEKEARSDVDLPACRELVNAAPSTRPNSTTHMKSEVVEQALEAAGSELPICDADEYYRIAILLPAEAVARYLDTLVTRSETLLQNLSKPDFDVSSADALSGAAHMLAGSAGMFGFQRLALTARNFEQAAETNSPEMPDIVKSLIATLGASVVEMQSRASTKMV